MEQPCRDDVYLTGHQAMAPDHVRLESDPDIYGHVRRRVIEIFLTKTAPPQQSSNRIPLGLFQAIFRIIHKYNPVPTKYWQNIA